MKKIPAEEYLLKAKKLTQLKAERLFLRMGGKLGRRFDDSKLVPLDALAIQLELYELRSHQLDRMPETFQLPRPEMSAPTRFHPDQTRLQIRKEFGHILALYLLA